MLIIPPYQRNSNKLKAIDKPVENTGLYNKMEQKNKNILW